MKPKPAAPPTPTTLAERLDTLYRLRTEQAEHKAETWENIARLVMEQNQDHVAGIRQIQRQQQKLDDEMGAMRAFVTHAESVVRRALAALDGSNTEDKTEVREALAKLLHEPRH